MDQAWDQGKVVTQPRDYVHKYGIIGKMTEINCRVNFALYVIRFIERLHELERDDGVHSVE